MIITFSLTVTLAAALFVMGRQRVLSLASLSGVRLHSRPNYYGVWFVSITLLPAFFLATVWALASRGIIQNYVLTNLPLKTLNIPQQDALWRDIQAAAQGENGSAPSALLEQGLELYKSATQISMMGLSLLIFVVVIGLALWGSRKITPEFRARNHLEKIILYSLLCCAGVAVLTTIGIVLSLLAESLRFFTMVPVFDFLFGLTWTPQQMAFRADQAGGNAAFGFLPLLTGTLLITTIAISVAAPIGLLSAIYLSFYAAHPIRAVGKPMLEVLAGIPTVVYGFFAALTVAPAIRGWGESLGLSVSSESALAAGVVMGIMIVPFISSLSDDVINAVPQSLKDGSIALGATQSETVRKVVIPAALPGIVSAMILAVSRAIGETMIVVMAAGLAANLTLNPLDAVTTVTVQIGTLLTGDQEFDSPKTLSAFALGLALFLITLTLNLIALKTVKKYRELYD